MSDLLPGLFFNKLIDLYANAAGDESSQICLRMGTHTIKIHFSGSAIKAHMVQSLSHILVDNVTQTDLSIYCFESSMLDAFPWDANAYGAQGTVEGYNTKRYQTAYQHTGGAVMMYDQESKEGIYWIKNFTDIPYWECSFPFRNIVHWWSRDTPYLLLHAAGIGNNLHSGLLSGKSGSGKSSTTLSCLLRNDLKIAGDDYVLVDTDQAILHSVYNCAKVEFDNLERLDFLRPLVNTNIDGAEKAMMFLNDKCPDKVMLKSTLTYAFIPQVCKTNKTAIVSCTEAEVLKSIAPTTMFQLPFAQGETFRKCTLLAKKLKPFRIELGTDAFEIATTIAQFFTDKNKS